MGTIDHFVVIPTSDARVAVGASSGGAGAPAVVPGIANPICWVGPLEGGAWQEGPLESSPRIVAWASCVVALLAG